MPSTPRGRPSIYEAPRVGKLSAGLDPPAHLGQDPDVITGYNTDIKHNDRVFHVQTEDKGIDNPTIESLVYVGGKILASRQYSYASLVRGGYKEKEIQDLVDSQHRKMVRDIRGGKFDPDGPPPFGAGIISELGFDDVVREFMKGQSASEGIEIVFATSATPVAGQLLVVELGVRGEVLNGRVPGIPVSIKAVGNEPGREVSLFDGVTDQTGMVRAGVDIPREFNGGTLVVSATAPTGSDVVSLEIGGP